MTINWKICEYHCQRKCRHFEGSYLNSQPQGATIFSLSWRVTVRVQGRVLSAAKVLAGSLFAAVNFKPRLQSIGHQRVTWSKLLLLPACWANAWAGFFLLLSRLPSDTKFLLTKKYSKIIIFEKLRISRVISRKSLSFLEILRECKFPPKLRKIILRELFSQ